MTLVNVLRVCLLAVGSYLEVLFQFTTNYGILIKKSVNFLSQNMSKFYLEPLP